MEPDLRAEADKLLLRPVEEELARDQLKKVSNALTEHAVSYCIITIVSYICLNIFKITKLLKLDTVLISCTSYFRGGLQGGDSQNFSRQIRKIFVTLGLNMLRFLRLKVVF